MPVSAALQLDDRERELLARILGCPKSKLEQELAPYATAALEEWTRMFIGERVYTRAGDLREYRLFLLIKHVWKRVPVNRVVSALFQTTTAGSGTLVRNVLSKFRYELGDTLGGSLKATLEAARRLNEGELQLLVPSTNLVDALNERIEELDPSLPRLSPGDGVASYRLRQSSYEALCRALGVEPRP
jgi:hypothetical protein